MGSESQSATASWGEVCRLGGDADIDAACAEMSRAHPWRVNLNAGFHPLVRPRGAIAPFESFDGTWSSAKVDPELARSWTELPAVANLELRYPVTPHTFLAFRAGLRRDLRAWADDPLGSNLPLSDREVDLNEPTLGFFRAESDHFALTVGRFPVHWSPSPDYGLALSRSVPYHNGAEFALKLPHVRYRFLVSGLNPWLQGTPATDSSSEDYPPGSEEYRQRHYPRVGGANLFHRRVYAERIKTLFAHRLEALIGPLTAGVTETQIIGGKVPDFRDAGPFIVYHNDFKEGWANGAVSVDARLRLPKCFEVFGEHYWDDATYSETEGGSGETPSLTGWMAGVRHAFKAGGWLFGQSLHAVRTDPFLYGYLQPLNTAASRIILASNDQRDGDSLFVDKYVIDYPIGYFRGGDAFDFWYRVDAWKGSRWHGTLATAWLSRGEVDLYTPYETYYSASHESPSGTPEREWRISAEGEWTPAPWPSLRAGAAWRSLWNEGHVRGKDRGELRVSAGVGWAFPP